MSRSTACRRNRQSTPPLPRAGRPLTGRPCLIAPQPSHDLAKIASRRELGLSDARRAQSCPPPLGPHWTASDASAAQGAVGVSNASFQENVPDFRENTQASE